MFQYLETKKFKKLAFYSFNKPHAEMIKASTFWSLNLDSIFLLSPVRDLKKYTQAFLIYTQHERESVIKIGNFSCCALKNSIERDTAVYRW